jgi:3-deoxy-manno-octulosonate cytidylyltransferase (CMP-KDO synthetase)
VHRSTSPATGRKATPGRKQSAPATHAAVGIVPARLSSTRLPEKALADLGGAPLVVRVLERARGAAVLREVLVATDSGRVAEAVRAAGARAILTRGDHETGLDRVAEAARTLEEAGEVTSRDVIVDIQGDEPFASLEGIGAMVALFGDPEVRMVTLAAPFPPGEDPRDPNRVKVVIDRAGRALYFSRAPIPHGATAGAPSSAAGRPLLHIGLYAFRHETLQALAGLPACPLEQAERLEQLRALWHGLPIHVAVGDYHSYGIDTRDDLERARRIWGERRSSG